VRKEDAVSANRPLPYGADATWGRWRTDRNFEVVLGGSRPRAALPHDVHGASRGTQKDEKPGQGRGQDSNSTVSLTKIVQSNHFSIQLIKFLLCTLKGRSIFCPCIDLN
jgi:hypothetical protein